MSLPVAILIIILAALAEGFFSGSEIAIVSIDKFRLRHNAKLGHRPSRLVLEMLKKPEWVLGTTLVGTNICTVLSTTLAAAQFYILFGEWGILVSILVMAFINWIFAEIVPKSIYQQLSNTIALKVAYPLRFFTILFFPVVFLFSKIAYYLAYLVTGSKPDRASPFVSREELKMLMSMTERKGDVKPTEKKMISRLLTFTETEAKEIMVPLIEVDVVSENATVKEAAMKVAETKHRRLPVFSGRVDKIVGILNSFDILGEKGNRKIKPFIRQALYVPPTINITTLLEQLQSTGENMAIIVDEFGGAEGVVTIEDILEEVVGEIEDEYDEIQSLYKVQKDGSIIVSGRMEIDEINELFNLNLPEGDYETISGLVIDHLKKIPQVGETLNFPNVVLFVQQATNRAVLEVKIQRKPQDSD
jgi:CBS domain containing-hemolysin-like protein